MGPRFQSFGPFVISFVPRSSAIMPISLPNASRTYSVASPSASSRSTAAFLSPLSLLHIVTFHFFFSLHSTSSVILLLLLPLLLRRRRRRRVHVLALHRLWVSSLLTLSRRFLRIDVIGLFALFRLRVGSIVRDASFASRERDSENYSPRSRFRVTTTLRAERERERAALCTYVHRGNTRETTRQWTKRNMEIYARTLRILRIIKGIWSVDARILASPARRRQLVADFPTTPPVIDEPQWRPLCLIHACNL